MSRSDRSEEHPLFPLQVSERVVLAQKAYILFYIRSPVNGRCASAPPAPRLTMVGPLPAGAQTAPPAEKPSARVYGSVPRSAAAAALDGSRSEQRLPVKRKLAAAFPEAAQQQQQKQESLTNADAHPLAQQVPKLSQQLCMIYRRAWQRLHTGSIDVGQNGSMAQIVSQTELLSQAKKRCVLHKMEMLPMAVIDEAVPAAKSGKAEMECLQAMPANDSVSPFASSAEVRNGTPQSTKAAAGQQSGDCPSAMPPDVLMWVESIATWRRDRANAECF